MLEALDLQLKHKDVSRLQLFRLRQSGRPLREETGPQSRATSYGPDGAAHRKPLPPGTTKAGRLISRNQRPWRSIGGREELTEK